MTVSLIAGANSGIGLAAARQLPQLGHAGIGSRVNGSGRSVETLYRGSSSSTLGMATRLLRHGR